MERRRAAHSLSRITGGTILEGLGRQRKDKKVAARSQGGLTEEKSHPTHAGGWDVEVVALWAIRGAVGDVCFGFSKVSTISQWMWPVAWWSGVCSNKSPKPP